MMDSDFITVLWKELKEIALERSAGGTGSFRPLILVAVLGIFIPLRMGPERFFSVGGILAPVVFRRHCRHRRYCRLLRRRAGTPHARNTARHPAARTAPYSSAKSPLPLLTDG